MTIHRDRTIEGLIDGAALDVLRRADTTGYVLTGPHDRVCRRDPGARQRRTVVDISRAEQATVQALAVAGLLDLDGAVRIVDHGDTRWGYEFTLSPTGRRALTGGTTR